MENSIRTHYVKQGFVKQASTYGYTLKEANDLFKNLQNLAGVESVKGLTDNFFQNIQENAPQRYADSTGIGAVLGGSAGALGGGLAGALGGGLTGNKEDSLETRLKRALGFGTLGALGGGLGGAVGGGAAGHTGVEAGTVGGMRSFLDALKKQYALE